MRLDQPLDQLELIERLYDSAESPDGLRAPFQVMAEVWRSKTIHSMLVDPRRGVVDGHFAGEVDDAQFVEYEQHWHLEDPRVPWGRANFERVLSDVEVIDSTAFENSALYNDLLKKQGIRFSLFSYCRMGENALVAHSLMRSKNEGPFSPGETAAFQRLQRHLNRVLRLRSLVDGIRDEISDLRRALDLVPGALFILDGVGRVVSANTAAERLLDTRDGLRLEASRLAARSGRETQQLAVAVAEAAGLAQGLRRPAGSRLSHSRTVLISRAEKRALGVVLLPLRPVSALRELGHHAARVLAIVHDPDAVVLLDPVLIGELHGLTPTEAALASALAQGRTLSQFAAERGCSEETARTHLKRVLGKTETRRQTDLVRMLLGSAALHAVRGG